MNEPATKLEPIESVTPVENNIQDFVEVSVNPATLQSFDETPWTPLEDFPVIFDRARKAQSIWKETSFKTRRKHVMKMADYLQAHADEIAQAISQDNGKTKMDALNTEVLPCIMGIHWYSKNTQKVLKDELLPPPGLAFFNKWSKRIYQPVGVVGIISAWNYPLSVPFGEIVMALMAGNGVVLRVAEQTVAVGKQIEKIIAQADLPQGLFTHVVGDGPKVLDTMLENGANKIFFTGSSATGRKIMARCAQYLTPCSLELGGNDPMLVLEDANIERAVNGALWGAFQNAGQTCAGVKRVYVHEKVYEQFVEMAAKKTKALRHGYNGHNSDIGSITTEKQWNLLKKALDEALQQGATIEAQSKAVGGQEGYFFPATMLTNVDPKAAFIQEEIFGPFMPVVKVSSLEEAIELANDSQYGLTASVWTKNSKLGKQVARQLEAGAVTINDHVYTHGLSNTEWGGPKDTGIGRTHGALGLQEMSESKIINWDVLPGVKRNIFWYPFDESLYKVMLRITVIANSKSILTLLKAGVGVIPGYLKRVFMRWKV